MKGRSEKLRVDVAERALISDRATGTAKRELFERLAQRQRARLERRADASIGLTHPDYLHPPARTGFITLCCFQGTYQASGAADD